MNSLAHAGWPTRVQVLSGRDERPCFLILASLAAVWSVIPLLALISAFLFALLRPQMQTRTYPAGEKYVPVAIFSGPFSTRYG
jgi:hypothetical protein